MRRRFLADGLGTFADHEVLELVLFYAIPRRNTNELAHVLMRRYGSFAGVLEADPHDLAGTDGIGDGASTLLSLIPALAERYRTDRTHRPRQRERCFGHVVDIEEATVRRALDSQALLDAIAAIFSRKIGELTAEKRDVKLSGEPYRLAETAEFSWRRHYSSAEKTIFNIVACYNQFEADFATFLDAAKDVDRFAKLCEWFTGFHVQYLKSSGAIGTYYPDFVVVQKVGKTVVNWIVETKGQEDVEVAAKDAQMDRWCQEVSAVTGTPWKYLKVGYSPFQKFKKMPSSFAELAAVFGGKTTPS